MGFCHWSLIRHRHLLWVFTKSINLYLLMTPMKGFFFVVQNSRARCIRAMYSGEHAMSAVRRPSAHRAYIHEVSKQTTILKLQGMCQKDSSVTLDHMIVKDSCLQYSIRWNGDHHLYHTWAASIHCLHCCHLQTLREQLPRHVRLMPRIWLYFIESVVTG